jgi:photosystem II stability/assembly factor-like uncharacterized protein
MGRQPRHRHVFSVLLASLICLASGLWFGRPMAAPATPRAVAVAQEPSRDGDDLQQGRGRGGAPAPEPVEPLRFRYMGPAPSSRIASVAGVPGDPTTYYLGSASGGVWKSTDSGATFSPVFDDMPSAAIGTLAVAPSDPNIVWAGTGEGWVIRPSDVMGDGIYKSTDAGKTWTHMGLDQTGRIGRIVIHPTNPNVVFACAVGRATGPQPERGVYRTTDGGTSWLHVQFVNEDTGCSGLAMDANDPNILIAGAWQVVQHTWQQYSGGPGSGVYISKDGGTRWTKVESGMPRSPVGKIDVAIAPSDSKRMYALIQTADQGSLWRSDDGGATFRVVSWDRSLIGRAGYYVRIAVNPQNADDVLIANSSFHRSSDGGLTFPGGGSCGDCHDIWLDPKDPRRYVLTDDAGATIVTPQGNTSVRLPNGQMYHVAIDTRVPYWIYSNRQDDGTMRGPSTNPESTGNGRLTAPVPAGDAAAGGRGARGAGGGAGGGRGGAGGPAWEPNIGGCESGFTIPDPTDADIIWATCYGNKVTRWDARTRTARSVSPSMITFDSAPNLSKYRCHWTAPLAIDPFDHNSVYYGCQVIFKTSNGGQSWTEISPDLSTRDPKLIVPSGGIVEDNLGQFSGALVYAIAPSPIQQGLLWAGTNDGKVWYTRTGAAPWTDVTHNITGLPPLGTVTKIEPSHFDPATAYVVVDLHIADNRLPFIYKTSDYGVTWRKVTGDLPATHPLDYVLSMAENPNKRGMLFAGTGHAFYYSMDDGAHWTKFREGLPPAPVTWIVVEPRYHDVVLSTYGRGLFILPDISLLEQTGQASLPATPSAPQLYTPRAGFRMARSGSVQFTFALPAAPTGPVNLQVLDAGGQVIRTLAVPNARAGLNRTTWNLMYEPARMVQIRTTPKENPHIWDEPDFKGNETRPVTHWGINATTATPIAAPGKYSVRMEIGSGQPLTQPFEILKDPAIPSPDADLVESTKMQVRIRDDISATSDMVNRMEITRKQIEDLLKANAGKDELERPLLDLNKKIFDVELQLVTQQDLRSDDKYFVDAYKVYMNLLWLGGAVGTGAGDEAGGADYKPRDVAYQILDTLEKDLAAAKTGFTNITDREIPAFNRTMAGKLPEIK